MVSYLHISRLEAGRRMSDVDWLTIYPQGLARSVAVSVSHPYIYYLSRLDTRLLVSKEKKVTCPGKMFLYINAGANKK